MLRADRNLITDLWAAGCTSRTRGAGTASESDSRLAAAGGVDSSQSLRLEGNACGTASTRRPGSLRDLGLADNAVENVGPLADLGGLRRLDLRGNAVEDLRPLSTLPSLVWVHVGGSRIKDLAPLDNLSGLTVAGREDRGSPSVSGEDDVGGAGNDRSRPTSPSGVDRLMVVRSTNLDHLLARRSTGPATGRSASTRIPQAPVLRRQTRIDATEGAGRHPTRPQSGRKFCSLLPSRGPSSGRSSTRLCCLRTLRQAECKAGPVGAT